MLSFKTQLLLIDFLKAVAEAETGVEITRLVLAEKKDFSPYNAFRDLDQLNKGFITVRDAVEFLDELELSPLEPQVRNFFYLYDSNDDLKLSFPDFQNAILPVTDLYLREIASNRPKLQPAQRLSYTASWALSRVIQKEIQFFNNIEAKREILVSKPDWDINIAFKTIAQERSSYIDPEAIEVFFKRCDSMLTSNEMSALFRRADRDADGKIDISEFIRLLYPTKSHGNDPSLDSPSRREQSPSQNRLNAILIHGNSPSRLSPEKVESPVISDSEYYQYLRDSAQLNSSKKHAESSPPLKERKNEKYSPRASSPTQQYESQSQKRSSRSRSGSPTFTKELTDYRVDSGYRTVKKYDQSPLERRSRRPRDYAPENNYQYISPERSAESPKSRGSKSRSRSPRFISEITDYRISSNYRTIKTYDDETSRQNTSPQRGREKETTAGKQPDLQSTPTKQRESSISAYDPTYSAGRRKSPVKFRLEPTVYREETGYRTVKTFDRNDTQIRQQIGECQSTAKEIQQTSKSAGLNEEISKKLEFEQDSKKK